MEIILASFVIKFCPGCGQAFRMGRYSLSDYIHGAAVSCECGVKVQYVSNTDILFDAADQAGGDISSRR